VFDQQYDDEPMQFTTGLSGTFFWCILGSLHSLAGADECGFSPFTISSVKLAEESHPFYLASAVCGETSKSGVV
jgi:hypothetical protein